MRIRHLLALALLITCALPAQAQNREIDSTTELVVRLVDDSVFQPPRVTFEQITVSTIAKSIASATTAGMQACQAYVETNTVRWRADGAAPTASVGTPAVAGSTIQLGAVWFAQAIQFIRASADATVWVTCWSAP